MGEETGRRVSASGFQVLRERTRPCRSWPRLAPDGGAKLIKATRDRIKHLLEVNLPGMIDQSLEEMTRGLGRKVIDASNNDATIGAFRRELIDNVEAVASTNPNEPQ